ncbi:Gas vesicle protein [Candidatus Ornithobacterium hominis]|uniref:Gas vesicle protein n=1 Tax=Candidatus Ornithobacterium hominis TaxID=2497989 RepID=A0A383TZ71_9FLAO|nr:YtxH domain-containing protein [Candidatus Ornithobacterium hominis]MCT7903974.1 YtxH domain-containing protein [Candidatus Ornithobacterium hominis]SZD72489.1 Gas vesicle protein [Candidatus Ornithobacterium hominis]
MKKSNETGAIIGSLLIGALAGAVAALLLAPQSGKETRNILMDELDHLKDEFDSYANDFSDKAQKIKADLQKKIKRTEAELSDIAHEYGI